MTLSSMMTATASTTRLPAKASGLIGDPVTHLESVKITPLMQPSASGQHMVRTITGYDGTAVHFWECYTESHEHTDDSVTVTQVPDILIGDYLVVSGTTYYVQWAKKQPATSGFGETLMLYVYEDESA